MSIEEYVLSVMEGRRWGRSLLFLPSLLYRSAVFLRNLGYDYQLLKTDSVPAVVVSIGNITAGGTGKTPLVGFLAKTLSQTRKVAILSRGYKSQVESTGRPFLVTETTPVEVCGDEPFWLAKEVPSAQVWVGKNRLLSAQSAIEKGAQVILLDDGMQHRSLKRDFEIVTLDGQDPFSGGRFLPFGFLRDAPQSLQRADLVVVQQSPLSQNQAIAQKISSFTNAPILFVKTELKLPPSISSFKGKKIGLFCALAKPDKFMQAVRSAGGEIVATYFKPDHEPFLAEDLSAFAKRSGADFLVCTEKDGVKLPKNFTCIKPLYPLRAELEIVQGSEAWQKLIGQINTAQG